MLSRHYNSNKTTKITISEDEKAVYDRQIRLWGLETQNRSVSVFVVLQNVF